MTTRDTPEAALAAALLRMPYHDARDFAADDSPEAARTFAAAILAALDGWTLVNGEWLSPTEARELAGTYEAEIARLRATLEQIMDYAPEWTDGDLPDHSDCPECARRRENHWPPSEMCEALYSAVWRRDDRNRQRSATQHYQMRDIARAALAPQEAGDD